MEGQQTKSQPCFKVSDYVNREAGTGHTVHDIIKC
jgi:hypothetical protein